MADWAAGSSRGRKFLRYNFGGTGGDGTFFKITPEGTLTTLHSFNGTDGNGPFLGPVQAVDGNFYGATAIGGSANAGTIFKITPEGMLTTLHNLDSTDGSNLYQGPIQATNGIFYGTAGYGGMDNNGTVFSLNAGLGPFVETLPTAGKVGEVVKILGTDLAGTAGVTFNGVPVGFRVVSHSLIVTAVPAGATSGFVTVTTPNRTLKSNVKFRVK